MSKKIPVLDATGAVGKPLVESLLARRETVKAASRVNRKIDRVESTPLDLDKPGTITTALEGVDRTCMLLPAGCPNLYDLFLPFVEAATSRRVKIVLQSTFGVDANDTNPMRQMEILPEESGTPHVILRPNWFSDGFHHFWKAGLDRGQIALPAGDSRTSFVDVRNITANAIAALTSAAFDGKAFNLTDPEALNYVDAVAILFEVTDKPVRYTAISDKAFVDVLENNGVPAANAAHMAPIFHPVCRGWMNIMTDDVVKFIGKRPRILREYTQNKVAALTAQGQATTPWASKVGNVDQKHLEAPTQSLFFQVEREMTVSVQFSKDHYWVRPANTLDGHAIDSVIVGVTPRALTGLDNLISVILPNVGETLARRAAAAEIESDKAVTGLYTPASGEIAAVSTALRDTPMLADADPLGAGWFFRVELSNPGQLDALLDEKAHTELFWAP